MISANAFGIVARINVSRGDLGNVREYLARCCPAKISVKRGMRMFRRSACNANSQHVQVVVIGNPCRDAPLRQIAHSGSVLCGMAKTVTSRQRKPRKWSTELEETPNYIQKGSTEPRKWSTEPRKWSTPLFPAWEDQNIYKNHQLQGVSNRTWKHALKIGA